MPDFELRWLQAWQHELRPVKARTSGAPFFVTGGGAAIVTER
jgi:hypothetical protein